MVQSRFQYSPRNPAAPFSWRRYSQSPSSGGARLYVKIRKIHAIEHHKNQRWGTTTSTGKSARSYARRACRDPHLIAKTEISHTDTAHSLLVAFEPRLSCVTEKCNPLSLSLCVGLNGVNHSRADGLPDLWVPRAGVWVSEQKKRKAAKSQLTMRCKSAGERGNEFFRELM